jgi:hypothetical protein
VSRYASKPLDLSPLRTVSLKARGGKVTTAHFARPLPKVDGFGAWLESLPHLLSADSLRAVVEALETARNRKRAIIWGLGGHVIKCGLAPVLIDLMRRGFATAFVLNGAAAIHDFEIALAGHTSEDVEAVLPDGSFGAAEETGREFNRALAQATQEGMGGGEALGRLLEQIGDSQFKPVSLLHEAYRASVPVTVHIAIGTDTPHMHPVSDGAAIGQATHTDFRLLCALARELNDGGVYCNVGSAVVLPEVFLKVVSAVRNLGHPITSFTTVNLDFLQHYRPRMNVVERPHAGSGGRGYSLTGHHEIMIPLLAALLTARTS